MAPEINNMRETLDAEIKAHQITKDELELTKRSLNNAMGAKTYAITKASEQTEEYERKLKDLHEKHAADKKVADDQNARLLAEVRALEKENGELDAAKLKLQRYNDQQDHNVKNLRFRLKIAKSAAPQALEGAETSSGEKRKGDWDEESEDEEDNRNKNYPSHKKTQDRNRRLHSMRDAQLGGLQWRPFMPELHSPQNRRLLQESHVQEVQEGHLFEPVLRFGA